MKHILGEAVHKILTKDATSTESYDEDGNGVSVGDWWAVEYEGMVYPGEVKVTVGDDYHVSVMAPAGKHWKWPVSLDETYYTVPKE